MVNASMHASLKIFFLVNVVQAHTCDNILELPNYLESLLAMHDVTDEMFKMTDELEQRLRNILDDRLKLAVTCCNGYGLD